MKKPFFCFFQGFKTHFLVLTRVKFLGPNHVIQFIDTKTSFLFFLTEKSRYVYLLYYQPTKKDIRTEVSPHVS